jgi:hypothetical protein
MNAINIVRADRKCPQGLVPPISCPGRDSVSHAVEFSAANPFSTMS